MLLDEESEQEGVRSTAPPLSATSLARCILDVDEERVEEHLMEVALALKAEVRRAGTHALRGKAGGGGALVLKVEVRGAGRCVLQWQS